MQATAQKKGPGCGCFGLVVVLVVVGAVMLGTVALLQPWSFYLGGTFHPLPYWQGWGRMHSQSGDYLVYLWMWPSRSKYMAHLSGQGELCTPRGERFTLRFGADMDRHVGRDMNGKAIRIYGYNHPWNWQYVNDDRPELDLRGQWQNPNIVLNDRGTLLNNFKPDGTLYPKGQHATTKEPLQLVLNQGSHADYAAACNAHTKQATR